MRERLQAKKERILCARSKRRKDQDAQRHEDNKLKRLVALNEFMKTWTREHTS